MRDTIAWAIRKMKLARMLLSAQKMVSFTLVLCVAASYFAMQVVLAPSVAMINEIRYSPMTDSYSIDFSESGISEKSNQLLIDLFAGRKTVLEQYVISGFYGSFFEDQPTVLGVKNCGMNSWYVQAEGRYFTESEENEGASVAIISRYDYQWNDFDIEQHSIEIGGSVYQLVGLGEFTSPDQFFIGKQEVYQKLSCVPELQELLSSSFTAHEQHAEIDELQEIIRRASQTVLIPYTSFEEKEITPTVVCLLFPEATGKKKEELKQELSALFPEAIVTAPPDAEQFMAATMQKETAVSLALSCNCLLFLYALFSFWIDRNRKAIRSCRIVGGSEKKVRGLVYLSWFFILFIGYILSIVISEICMGFFVKMQMNMHLQGKYHVALFMIPAIITLGLMSINLSNQRWREIVQ